MRGPVTGLVQALEPGLMQELAAEVQVPVVVVVVVVVMAADGADVGLGADAGKGSDVVGGRGNCAFQSTIYTNVATIKT